MGGNSGMMIDGEVNENFFGAWQWLEDDVYEVYFNEDGTGRWSGVADSFEWHGTDTDVYLYVNDVRWWHGAVDDGRLILSSLVADVSYDYVREGELEEVGVVELAFGETFALSRTTDWITRTQVDTIEITFIGEPYKLIREMMTRTITVSFDDGLVVAREISESCE